MVRQRRRAWLGDTDEKRAELETVTWEEARRRVALWRRLAGMSNVRTAHENRRGAAGGYRPDRDDVWWDPEEEREGMRARGYGEGN